jgi:hypothetical protein
MVQQQCAARQRVWGSAELSARLRFYEGFCRRVLCPASDGRHVMRANV